MCIALIGGMDRLERQYLEEGARLGIHMRVFTRSETNMTARLRHVNAMVIFTNKVSHRARNEAVRAAKANAIPVLMCHSCGVCTLRECLNCLAPTKKEGSNDVQDGCFDVAAGAGRGRARGCRQ